MAKGKPEHARNRSPSHPITAVWKGQQWTDGPDHFLPKLDDRDFSLGVQDPRPHCRSCQQGNFLHELVFGRFPLGFQLLQLLFFGRCFTFQLGVFREGGRIVERCSFFSYFDDFRLQLLDRPGGSQCLSRAVRVRVSSVSAFPRRTLAATLRDGPRRTRLFEKTCKTSSMSSTTTAIRIECVSSILPTTAWYVAMFHHGWSSTTRLLSHRFEPTAPKSDGQRIDTKARCALCRTVWTVGLSGPWTVSLVGSAHVQDTDESTPLRQPVPNRPGAHVPVEGDHDLRRNEGKGTRG